MVTIVIQLAIGGELGDTSERQAGVKRVGMLDVRLVFTVTFPIPGEVDADVVVIGGNIIGSIVP